MTECAAHELSYDAKECPACNPIGKCKTCDKKFNKGWPHLAGNRDKNVYSYTACNNCYHKEIDRMLKQCNKILGSS